MPVSVTMPRLGESVAEGTVTRWLKREGDQVEIDEPLLEISTDKVDTEIPAPASGTLTRIIVAEDETVQVGSELAIIGTAPAPEPAAPPASPAPPATPPAPPAPPAAVPPPAPARVDEPGPAGREKAGPAGREADHETGREKTGGYVTPLVRKLAADHGIDLSAVSGTGVGGRVRKQDVLEAAENRRAAEEAERRRAAEAAEEAEEAERRRTAEAARRRQTVERPETAPGGPPTAGVPATATPPANPLRGRTEKMTRLRQIIAARMVESLQTSAQLTTVVEVDVTRIARLREQAKGRFTALHGVKLSFLPFFALATVEALRQHPSLNASIDSEANTVTYHGAEHLAIAVATERGLMVPVIHDAGDLNLVGLAKRIADLAGRTRAMKVEPDELSGGTFTLTNTGSRGALLDTPIINQPQVGILGTGTVVKRAVVVDDPDLGELIVPRSMIYLSLSYDHRLVDGADAATFLTTIKERLEVGAFEAELGLT